MIYATDFLPALTFAFRNTKRVIKILLRNFLSIQFFRLLASVLAKANENQLNLWKRL